MDSITLVENEDFTFAIENIEKDSAYECRYVNVYIKNNKDIPVYFSWDNVVINGYNIDPMFGGEIEPNSEMYTNAILSEEELSKSGIKDIETITLTLDFCTYDEDTYEILETLTSENCVINFE